jgi:citrate synthase
MLKAPKGLAGVVVADTAVSLVDGAAGTLAYRGKIIGDLVDLPFLDVANWVSRGRDGDEFTELMLTNGNLSRAETELVLSIGAHAHPMQVLQAVTPVLDPSTAFAGLADVPPDAVQGFSVAAKLPAIIATRLNGKPVELEGDYVEGFLAAINSNLNAEARQAFNGTQILQIEHSLNASTFVARSVASTLAPVENCLSAAFGSLHGVLHGGADQAALETADRVGCAVNANAFVDRCIATGEKVMGMGHREYRVVDPRARLVKRFAEQIARGTEHESTYETLVAIDERFNERMQERGKALYANVEFYKGLVFRVIGFPPAYFTALFAMARVFGYLAHFIESRVDNRIVRPAAHYVGPTVALP